ncbi:PREDICTED: DNA repair protein RAD4 isoform X2 [Nelumbo nucifera]|uniref:DNA repair protein RAD4 isoform X2 n=1 Tax=Nelumbo nucifera TaxID=4432 RepID=A0A1U8ATJ0_NELNU|nr:PREDICTED: DNA repair protein RAD4 isoform X2 [Nelumbo nucifera]
MRPRNQSKRQRESTGKKDATKAKDVMECNSCTTLYHDNGLSRGDEGSLLKQASFCNSLGKKKKGSSISNSESDAMPEDGQNGSDKQDINMKATFGAKVVGARGQDPNKSTQLERKVEEPIISCTYPGQEEDMDESDWEDGSIPVSNSRSYHLNNLTGEVTVEFSESLSPAKRKSIRRASVEDKELAELVHKVHLLCLIARGRLIDKACNDPLIQASLLSLLPKHLMRIAEVPKLTVNVLAPLVSWFHDNFHLKGPSSSDSDRSFKAALAHALETRAGAAEEVAALSVALFRALDLTTRFVSVLDVASLKPEVDMPGCSNQDATRKEMGIFNSSTLMVSRLNQAALSPSPIQLSLDKTTPKGDIAHESSHKAEGSKRKGDLEFELQLEMALSATAAGICEGDAGPDLKELHTTSGFPSLRRLKRIKTEDSIVSSQGVSTALGSRKVGPPLHWAEVYCNGENLTGKWVHIDAANAFLDGEHKVEAAVTACRTSLRYVVAFAGHGAKDVTRRYCMKWYKIASQRINSHWWDTVLAPLRELESHATGGVVQLEVHQESASTRKDLQSNESMPEMSSREVSKEHGANINVEISTQNSTIATRNVLEDMELETRALTEPLPTNQQAYKNHHLYAIERWLTKYQILHPKGPILGFCSGHPVYPRSSVQTLQTKQRWLREGLQVKENELPAKVVRRSLKLVKTQDLEFGNCNEDNSEGTLELYGKWQMEPLCLPQAVNGIVPKNERGQVDVWSEKCLPPGTVHLRLPRVVPVVKRLEIDFAPAMVGFEFRNGRSIPIFEGIVVCKEFKGAILEAYAEEGERRDAEEKRRIEAQSISRWYQLLSSIITRQRLNNCYGGDSFSQASERILPKDEKYGPKTCTSKDDVQSLGCHGHVRGANSDTQSAVLGDDHEHVFPVEDQSFDEESSVRTKRCPCGFSVQVEEL